MLTDFWDIKGPSIFISLKRRQLETVFPIATAIGKVPSSLLNDSRVYLEYIFSSIAVILLILLLIITIIIIRRIRINGYPNCGKTTKTQWLSTKNKEKKRMYQSNSGYCRSGKLQSKIKRRGKKDKYLNLSEKTIEYEGNGDTTCNWCTWNNPQQVGKGTGK